jgi:hypothetical protein
VKKWKDLKRHNMTEVSVDIKLDKNNFRLTKKKKITSARINRDDKYKTNNIERN